MKIRDEIEKYAREKDKPALRWLFDRYHWDSEWKFVSRFTKERYGIASYAVNRVWKPSIEGQILYDSRPVDNRLGAERSMDEEKPFMLTYNVAHLVLAYQDLTSPKFSLDAFIVCNATLTMVVLENGECKEPVDLLDAANMLLFYKQYSDNDFSENVVMIGMYNENDASLIAEELDMVVMHLEDACSYVAQKIVKLANSLVKQENDNVK